MSWVMDAMTIAGGIAILIGALFAAIAAFGLLRLPDAFGRMHTASKPQTLGVALIAVGLALVLHEPAASSMLVLVALLQLLTAPVASQMIARSAYRTGAYRQDLLRVDESGDEQRRGDIVG